MTNTRVLASSNTNFMHTVKEDMLMYEYLKRENHYNQWDRGGIRRMEYSNRGEEQEENNGFYQPKIQGRKTSVS